MKLAAIYNSWDNAEMLRGSMNCLKNDVDLFIIVYQEVSNFGEHYNPLPDMNLHGLNYTLVKYTPVTTGGMMNETNKRNFGLEVAKKENCTHFLFLDNDEYYENFAEAKKQYIDSGKNGSVCSIYTYFKKPIWRFKNIDNYFVPFIHKLFEHTKAGNRQYPHYVDPTRRVNEEDVAVLDTKMHHFSYVRNNIDRKINNSSARNNILRSQLLDDYNNINDENADGYFVKDFNQTIIIVENLFAF